MSVIAILRQLRATGGHVGWQRYVRRRWHEAQVQLDGERVGNSAEPRDRGISDRKRPMEHEYKGQVHPQSDGGSGKGEASNHPALVPDRIASQNEPHSERGRYNPGRAQREKSYRSDPASLRMGRDPE